jgi:hypothetical protein
LIAGCAYATKTGATPYLSRSLSQSGRRRFKNGQSPIQPALISLDNQTGAFDYWQIQQGGSQNPVSIYSGLGIGSEYGMAANGNVLAIASYALSEIVTYDLLAPVKRYFPIPMGLRSTLQLQRATQFSFSTLRASPLMQRTDPHLEPLNVNTLVRG